MLFQPHFVRDYRRVVRTLKQRHGLDDAMSLAVGGHYEHMGAAQVSLLHDCGLRDDDAVLDVGCGSGRTAYALRQISALRYHGTDVVPDLIAYARAKVDRDDWRFSVVDGLCIPERDGWADIVTMFSVLTHLTAREGLAYLVEASRVTRPGGQIIASFLDPALDAHIELAGSWLRQAVGRIRGTMVKNVMLSRNELQAWADALRLDARFVGPERIGQSYCVFTKTA
jgi:ubiquinone/menaquinone biosynthesis C-methylase UbiE